MTPRHSTKGSGEFLDIISLGLSMGGSDGGSAAEYTVDRGGTGGNNSRAPGTRRTSTATGDKDRGLDDGAAFHSEWDQAGGSVMK